jgi:hypothetical protein
MRIGRVTIAYRKGREWRKEPTSVRPAEQGGSMTETATEIAAEVSTAGTLVNGWDAAFCPDPVPTTINGRRMAYAGFYLGGSSAFRTWTDGERRRLAASRQRAMPIWVPTPGHENPRQVALQAISALKAVGIPPHATPFRALMWDLETGVEPAPQWLTIAANTLAFYGYDNLVYGSPGGSQIFSEPARLGYIVAFYDGRPSLYPHANAVGKQYQANVSVPGGQVDLNVLESSILPHLGSVT